MLRAVILDTSAVARNLLTSVLTNGGHQVVADGNLAAQSLARVIKLKPQIVCIDLGDHSEESFAIIDQLRSQLPKALLFLVSATLDANTIQLAQAKGVQGFIVKPVNSVAVLSAIRNTIIRLAKQSQKQRQEQADDQNDGAASQVG